MEELIDLFLDELIDKKEISQNERTDMKLTLLEAMPNGLNDETKTRVMSTLKSKMETPSANIFTDKGVNIEAVRTIATETVKIVVETVEKETSAREEAEAKRAAKVDDALSQTIAEADKKEELKQEQLNNNVNKNDEKYDSPFFKGLSLNSVKEAYEKLDNKYGDRYSSTQKLAFAEAEVAYDDFGKQVSAKMEATGKSKEECREMVLEERSGGSQEQRAHEEKVFELQAKVELFPMISQQLQYTGSLDTAVRYVLDSSDKFVGIKDVKKIVDEYIKYLSDKGIDINLLMDSEDLEDTQFLIETELISHLQKGKSFFAAVDIIKNEYGYRINNIENLDEVISSFYNMFLRFGLTKEELEDGNIPIEKITHSKWYDFIAVMPEEDEYSIDTPENPKKEESQEVEPQDSTLPSKSKSQSSNHKRYNASFKAERAAKAKMKSEEIKKVIEITEECEADARDELWQELNTNLLEINSEYDNTLKFSKRSRLIFDNYNSKTECIKKTIKDIRDIDEEEKAKGLLTFERKNIIDQRERFTKKIVNLYLMGEKSAYEIIKDLGIYAQKFEILPDDIISEANKFVSNANIKDSNKLQKYEETMVSLYERLDAANVALKNAENEKDFNSMLWISSEIRRLEERINNCKVITNGEKAKIGSIGMKNASAEENELYDDIKAAYEFTNQMKHLKEIQIVYTELKKEHRNNPKSSFSDIAIKYFASKMVTAQKFGGKLLNALNQIGDGEEIEITPELLEECIKDANTSYMEIIKKNISQIDNEIARDKNKLIIDDGYTDSLVERDKLERELKKAEVRDDILNGEKLINRRQLDTELLNIKIKQGAIKYFSNDYTVADIVNEYRRQGFEVNPTDVIKRIMKIAEKADIDKNQIKLLADAEMEIYKDYIRIEGLNQLKGNAERMSKTGHAEGFVENIKKVQKGIQEKKEMASVFKQAVNERIPNIYEGIKPQNQNKPVLTASGVRKKTLHLANKNISQLKPMPKDSRIKLTNPREESQDNTTETHKKGINMLNIAKVVEANGTTSQDIVGEVTDLNKIARTQDDRVVDSSEQRDS